VLGGASSRLWGEATAGDLGVEEVAWREMFDVWQLSETPPRVATQGPHQALLLSLSRVDENPLAFLGKWTLSAPASKILTHAQSVQRSPDVAQRLARLLADQVVIRERSSRGFLLSVEQSPGAQGDVNLSPTALLVSSLRHHMIIAASFDASIERPAAQPLEPDRPRSPLNLPTPSGQSSPGAWTVANSWSWLRTQCSAPADVEATYGGGGEGGGYAMGQSLHDGTGSGAARAGGGGGRGEDDMAVDEELFSDGRVTPPPPGLLAEDGDASTDTLRGFTVAGGPCLLTSDLLLVFTSLLAHYPRNGDLQGSMRDADAGQRGTQEGGAHVWRLVRLMYTAHVVQVLLALRDASCSMSNWCVADEAMLLCFPFYLASPKRCLLKLSVSAVTSAVTSAASSATGCQHSSGVGAQPQSAVWGATPGMPQSGLWGATPPACPGGALGGKGGSSAAGPRGWGLRELLDYFGEGIPPPNCVWPIHHKEWSSSASSARPWETRGINPGHHPSAQKAAAGALGEDTMLKNTMERDMSGRQMRPRTMQDLAEFIASLEVQSEAGGARMEDGCDGVSVCVCMCVCVHTCIYMHGVYVCVRVCVYVRQEGMSWRLNGVWLNGCVVHASRYCGAWP